MTTERTGYVRYEVTEPSDVKFIEDEDVGRANSSGTWKENQWYKIPFDGLVCVQTKGQSVYAKAELTGLIYFNGSKTYRGSLLSAAHYLKGLDGEYWKEGNHSFNFPVLTGESFMVYKSMYSPDPDWVDIFIQVIPFSKPEKLK